MSTSDVNLRRILFTFGTFFSITAGAAAVARILPVCLGGLIFIIFGRRLWQCSVFSSLLLLDQLKEQRKKSKKKQKDKNS
jgi:hypothetical protein